MNALPASSKWLVLGLGVYAVAALACSAEASSPPPQTGTPNNNTGGSGGSGTGLPLAGSTSTPTGGSTATGTAGTTATGTAGTATGTAGTAPVGTAGTGAGGGGALAACPAPPAAGAIADLLIDDLEDGDNAVARVGNRTGYWYTYLDTLASTIIPLPAKAPGAAPLKPGSTDCHGASKACIMISGTTSIADTVAGNYPYAGVGFDFSNAGKPCVYNASAYTGIKFWARGDVPITIKLNTTATATADGGGTCTGMMCNGGFSPAGTDVVLTAAWQQIDINFATAAPPTWAAALALHPDKANLVGLQVQIPPGQTFNVAVDDFTFY